VSLLNRAKQQESPFTTEWVVALQTFCSDTPTWGLMVKAGARYPANHPIPQTHPGQFCDDHLSNGEMRQIIITRFDRPIAEDFPVTILPAPLRDEDAVVAIRSRVAYVRDARGRLTPKLDNYEKGQKFSRNHAIPKEYPEDFEPVAIPQAEPLVQEV